MIEYVVKVVNGKIPRSVSEDIGKLFRRMEGKSLVIGVKLHRKKRSTNQNAYYWGCVIKEILEQSGNTHLDPREFHQWLKANVGHLFKVVEFTDPLSGQVTRDKVLRSSKELNTQEWEDYMEQCRAWAAGFGVIVPLPNEHLSNQYGTAVPNQKGKK